MPSSRIRPPTPPTDFQLPPDVTSTRDTLATGAIAYSFRHARLGLLGRLVIRGIAIIGPDLYDKGVLPEKERSLDHNRGLECHFQR